MRRDRVGRAKAPVGIVGGSQLAVVVLDHHVQAAIVDHPGAGEVKSGSTGEESADSGRANEPRMQPWSRVPALPDSNDPTRADESREVCAGDAVGGEFVGGGEAAARLDRSEWIEGPPMLGRHGGMLLRDGCRREVVRPSGGESPPLCEIKDKRAAASGFGRIDRRWRLISLISQPATAVEIARISRGQRADGVAEARRAPGPRSYAAGRIEAS
jgi:hypothetical protein